MAKARVFAMARPQDLGQVEAEFVRITNQDYLSDVANEYIGPIP